MNDLERDFEQRERLANEARDHEQEDADNLYRYGGLDDLPLYTRPPRHTVPYFCPVPDNDAAWPSEHQTALPDSPQCRDCIHARACWELAPTWLRVLHQATSTECRNLLAMIPGYRPRDTCVANCGLYRLGGCPGEPGHMEGRPDDQQGEQT